MSSIIKLFKAYKTHDLLRSISTGYAAFLITNVVALFLTPYILKYVPSGEYGLYLLCIDILSWMALFQFGTSQVLSSNAGQLIAQGSYEKLNKAYNSAFFFQVLISILVIPIYFIVVYFGSGLQEPSKFIFIISLFSVSAGLQIYKELFSGILIASKKIYLDNLIQITFNILSYALILFLVPSLGVVSLAIVNLLVVILIVARCTYRVKAIFPYLKIRRSEFEKSYLLNFLSQGLFFSIGSIAAILLTKFDGFFLGKHFGLEQVTMFYVTIKLFTLTDKVLQTLFNNFRPYISQNYGKGQYDYIFSFYRIGSQLMLGLALLILGSLLIINEQFVTWWVGHDFFVGREFSSLYVCFVVISLSTLPSRIILSSTLTSLKAHALFRVIEGCVRVLLVFLFFDYWEIAILPLSSMISVFIFGYMALSFLVASFFRKNSLSAGLSIHVPMLLFLAGVISLMLAPVNSYVLPGFMFFFGLALIIYLMSEKKNELLILLRR